MRGLNANVHARVRGERDGRSVCAHKMEVGGQGGLHSALPPLTAHVCTPAMFLATVPTGLDTASGCGSTGHTVGAAACSVDCLAGYTSSGTTQCLTNAPTYSSPPACTGTQFPSEGGAGSGDGKPLSCFACSWPNTRTIVALPKLMWFRAFNDNSLHDGTGIGVRTCVP